ncbi:MAG: molybdenum cofactor guanylyltransferase [Clostridia bacterium]|jgi:molybdopterin-guanine dinucleotide biosynthesis protein A|nr:molybdenum cofactor guanylyltransferase [Clostridiales bacterium]
MRLFGTAIILAGGKSKRMGFDKALMEICGQPIVGLIIKQLRKVFDDIIVVTNNPDGFSGLDARITSDILRDSGPLGGIHAGLMHSKSQYAFLTACDMPIVSPEYAKYMTEIAQEELPHAVISEKGSWIEPFHALYSRELTEDIERSVKRGIYKIFDVLKYKNVIRISENKVREYSPDLGVFTNLNHIKDLEEFLSRMEVGGMEDVLL